MKDEDMYFLQGKKVFTTHEAYLQGVSKQELKADKNIVCFGSFPTKVNGSMQLQNIWTYNEELAKLIKHAKRIGRKDEQKGRELASRVEVIVRDLLGFNLPVIDTAIGVSGGEENGTK